MEALTTFYHALPEKRWVKFFSDVFQDSKIVIIIGKRGSGKTALGFRAGEIALTQFGREVYIFGVEIPESGFRTVYSLLEVENGGFIVVDEAELFYHARRAMSRQNLDLSNIISIARHKQLSAVVISQSAAFLDINLIQMADYVWLKEPNAFLAPMERFVMSSMVADAELFFASIPPEHRREYFVSFKDEYYKFLLKAKRKHTRYMGVKKLREKIRSLAVLKCHNRLPSWWSPEISKLWAGYGEAYEGNGHSDFQIVARKFGTDVFTPKDVMKLLKLGKVAVHNRLKQWLSEGLLVKVGRGRYVVAKP